MTFDEALGLVRLLINRGINEELAISNPAVPDTYRDKISEVIEKEKNITLQPARFILSQQSKKEWLDKMDRSNWYYWPRHRDFLLGKKKWSSISVNSLDMITDKILSQIGPINNDRFDIRGLVLGYVQSGKTANFTALIAKAVDIGYRLIIVLSGVDKGLRRQTQIRLKREIVGYTSPQKDTIDLPDIGKRWHEFTTDDINGDFQPGTVNQAALQGAEPVLMVIKKNSAVLRRLISWLDMASEDIVKKIPVLVIDDEADQASVDTRGSYQTEDEEITEEYEEPSIINGHIRTLLNKFSKCSYVAYTATPFANILIPHDAYDPTAQNDLYPNDFIVDLPKPDGYFGTEELFGDFESSEDENQLDVIRTMPVEHIELLENGQIPESLKMAFLDFVLGGAARAQRGQGNEPCTMLIHVTRLKIKQNKLEPILSLYFNELKNEWRYQRKDNLEGKLKDRWENEFRSIIKVRHPEADVGFEEIRDYIGPFFEAVQFKVINSDTGAVLDYAKEPGIKAVAIGGDRLSRGLTLEGLMVSYFTRRSKTYDTLMQMGRWFGFRKGYEDLTRIITTSELVSWFSDLARVEHQIREDIQIYESQGITPRQLGTRIALHPAMFVTNPLKMRNSQIITIGSDYSEQLTQTVRFPFENEVSLNEMNMKNLENTKGFIKELGLAKWQNNIPKWFNIDSKLIIDFLRKFEVDDNSRVFIPLSIADYISKQNESQELKTWTIVIKGKQEYDEKLGHADWGINGGILNQISRTRLANDPQSIGVLTSPKDELEGLDKEGIGRVEVIKIENGCGINRAARLARPKEEGLLLIYPISKNSGLEGTLQKGRQPLFEQSRISKAIDIIGIALSFPASENARHLFEEYLVGTVGWRATE